MAPFLSFLDRYEILFYFVIGIILIVYGRKVYLAWKEWSIALFGLEKEHTQRQINQGITALIITFALGVGLFILTTFVSPSIPGIQVASTPTLDLTAQPTVIISTPTISTTTQGLIPTLTAILDKGCVPGQIEWTDPVDGVSISGKYVLKGTVNVPNLGFYTFEYAPIDSTIWTPIAAGNKTIIDEPLGGSWDTSSLTPGDYQLSLVVNDNQNNPMPECIITVTINVTK